MQALGCAVMKAYTWRHRTWDVRWLNHMQIHPAQSRWRQIVVTEWEGARSVFLVYWTTCVNCIMSNHLIFSIKQCVFFYGKYVLTQSASQYEDRKFQYAKLNMCSMTELLVGIYDLLILLTWPPAIFISGVDWKMLCTRQTHALWKNWNLTLIVPRA